MNRVGNCLLVVLPAAFSCIPASAETRTSFEMLACAGHFEARAEWMDALRSSPDTSQAMKNRAAILLAAAEAAMPPSDWAMFTGFGNSQSPTYREEFADATLDEMTKFAELGYGTAVLPLCVEDETCVICTKVLNEIVND